jgi:hypothetical protein
LHLSGESHQRILPPDDRQTFVFDTVLCLKTKLRFTALFKAKFSPRLMRRFDRAFRFSVQRWGIQLMCLIRPQKLKRRNLMKRSTIYGAVALGILLPGLPNPALAQIPSADTNVGPAAAGLNGVMYVAWKGKSTGADAIYYSTPNGSGWNPEAKVCIGSNCPETTEAPALAAIGNTLYLAWRGPSTGSTDQIYYSTTAYNSGWSSQAAICSGSTCAETIAPPALAGSGSTLYAAWTTSANTIEFATYTSGVWTFGPAPIASPYSGTAPALAVYNNTLFLAWLQQVQGMSSFQVMYATLPLSGAVWSPAAPTTASSSVPVGPSLAFYSVGSLYLAWTPASGAMDYSEYDGGSWGTPVQVPGLPVPPGPLTPALVSNVAITAICPNPVYFYSFSLVYSAPVSGKTYDDVYVSQLFGQTVGKCTCRGTTCQ